MMPKSDGKDVLSILRLHEKASLIPVIIISNLNPGMVDLSGTDEQVMEYWVKAEVTPKMLCERLQRYFSP